MAWKWKNFLRSILTRINVQSGHTEDESKQAICNEALDFLDKNTREMIILRSRVQMETNAREKEWQQ